MNYKILYQLYDAVQTGDSVKLKKIFKRSDHKKLLMTPITPSSKTDLKTFEDQLRFAFGGKNPLLISIEMGHIELVRQILLEAPSLLTKTDNHGNNVLHTLSETRCNEEEFKALFLLLAKSTKDSHTLLRQKNNLGQTPIDLYATTNRRHLQDLFLKDNELEDDNPRFFLKEIQAFNNYQALSKEITPSLNEEGNPTPKYSNDVNDLLKKGLIEQLIREIPNSWKQELTRDQFIAMSLKELGEHYGFEFSDDDKLQDILKAIRSKALSYQTDLPPSVLLSINLEQHNDPKDKLMQFVNFQMQTVIRALFPDEDQQKERLSELYDSLYAHLQLTNKAFFNESEIRPIVNDFLKTHGIQNRSSIDALSKALSQKDSKDAEKKIKLASDQTWGAHINVIVRQHPNFLSPQISSAGKNLQSFNLVRFLQQTKANQNTEDFYSLLLEAIKDNEDFKKGGTEEKIQLITKHHTDVLKQIAYLYPNQQLPDALKSLLEKNFEQYLKNLQEIVEDYEGLIDPANFNKPFNETPFFKRVQTKGDDWIKRYSTFFDESTQQFIENLYKASRDNEASQLTAHQIALKSALDDANRLYESLKQLSEPTQSNVLQHYQLIKELLPQSSKVREKLQKLSTLAQFGQNFKTELEKFDKDKDPEKMKENYLESRMRETEQIFLQGMINSLSNYPNLKELTTQLNELKQKSKPTQDDYKKCEQLFDKAVKSYQPGFFSSVFLTLLNKLKQTFGLITSTNPTEISLIESQKQEFKRYTQLKS